MSDAGEPHGTAGRPMLEVLQHCGVGEVAAVVSRWYGGVKLGRGGLSRAYAGGVARALETLPRSERVPRLGMELEFDYPRVDAVRRLLDRYDAIIEREHYGERIRYGIAIPADVVDVFRREYDAVQRG
jgi:putative IMPACT (imprinted ancient) family translation regulator